MNKKPKDRDRNILYRLTMAGVILALLLEVSALPAAQAQGAWNKMPAGMGDYHAEQAIPLVTSFTLDGVLVSVRGVSLPSADFTTSEPGSAVQVATSVAWKPFREFSIVAVPFGTRPATEALPAAAPGLTAAYELALRNYRLQQGGMVQDGLVATLFGRQVTGLHTLVDLNIDGPLPKPVEIDEWVVEAGARLWIIRSSEEQTPGGRVLAPEYFPKEIVLSSSTLDTPSTVNDQPMRDPALGSNRMMMVADLPTPAWWHGDCDNETYTQKSGGINSYRLGEVFLGVPACGPRPDYDGGQNVLVRFFPGAWGEYEWQCVEYAMRFMYLLYGISPYQANGADVVWNYEGDQFVKIANGTSGQAPLPNDVLSYGSTSTGGHSSVVTTSNVDAAGNGTVKVIEQNAAVTGASTLTVTDWSVAGNAGSVTGWLHSTRPALTLAVNKTGTGTGTVTSLPAGIDCGLTCTHAFNYYNVVTLTASAAGGSTFTGWSGDCSGTGTCTVTTDEERSVTANFDLLSFALSVSRNGMGSGTVTSNPAGIDCGSTCSTFFANNAVVTLTAVATAPSTFGGWIGAGCSGTGTCTVTMSSDRSVIATFNSPGTQTLTVSKDGTGGGTLTSDPLGIDCGSTCSASFSIHTGVTLTATPGTGSNFAGWSGACSGTGTCAVTMDADNAVAATFMLNTYLLSVSRSGTGSGMVTSLPAGIDCGLTCSYAFNYDTAVTLTAVASEGSFFTGWSGDCSGTGTCTVTTDAERSVTANFNLTQPGFADVPLDHWASAWIVRLYQAGITNGCATDPLRYCPEDPVTRGQMAVFLERGMQGSTYIPPDGTGAIFSDVPLTYWAVDWIEQFYADGITSGCRIGPLSYCPDNLVTRAEMAVFLLRARHGADYTPPEVWGGGGTGFDDVPADYWAAAWIKQLAAEAITTGCRLGSYCPENPVTRAEMAVFLVRTFDLP